LLHTNHRFLHTYATNTKAAYFGKVRAKKYLKDSGFAPETEEYLEILRRGAEQNRRPEFESRQVVRFFRVNTAMLFC
jgi:hypothetical protein